MNDTFGATRLATVGGDGRVLASRKRHERQRQLCMFLSVVSQFVN